MLVVAMDTLISLYISFIFRVHVREISLSNSQVYKTCDQSYFCTKNQPYAWEHRKRILILNACSTAGFLYSKFKRFSNYAKEIGEHLELKAFDKERLLKRYSRLLH